jgi:F-type H+-transporting ATPase subunit delta
VAAEVSVVSDIAGRYATALFELAQEANALDDVAKDLVGFRNTYVESDDLRRALRSPIYSQDDQAKAMDALLDKMGAAVLTRKFVGLVVKNRRAFALNDMAAGFSQLLSAHRGEVMAHVTSAVALSDAQIADVKAELAAAMKTDVTLETDVDEKILGGLVVKVGSRMVDSSMRTKLNNLKYAMRGVE